MNYELVKKLKDNEYPFKKIFVPTLSDLIEECGDRFCELSKGRSPVDALWTAQGYPIRTMFAHGKSPEEAVANLWFALQTK